MSSMGTNENVVAYKGYYRSAHVTQIVMELWVPPPPHPRARDPARACSMSGGELFERLIKEGACVPAGTCMRAL